MLRDLFDNWMEILVFAVACSLLAVGAMGCAPAPVTAPVAVAASPVDLFSQLADAADGGRFELKTSPAEISVSDQVQLISEGTISGTITRDGETVIVRFNRPYPSGRARKFGVAFKAGVETVELTRNKISAITDTFGKRFTWELKELP